MKEPPRLSSEGGRLTEALDGLRRQTPDSERLSRMVEALAAQGIDVQGIDVQGIDVQGIDVHAAPPRTQPTGTELAGKAGWSATKIGAGIGGVLAVGLAALLHRTPSESIPTDPSRAASPSTLAAAPAPGQQEPSAAAPQRSPASSAEVVEDSPRTDALADSEGTPKDSQPSAPSVGATATGTPAAPSAPPTSAGRPSESRTGSARASEQRAETLEPALATGESEISLLKRAREALSTNPGTALSLAEQHRERFRSGRLAQEREVIAITALVRLGQPTSAEKRAEQFARAYPGSAYAAQIRRVIGDD